MNAIYEVFEKMFFVFLEPVERNVKYDMVASLNFDGSIKGQITAYFTHGMIENMLKNMLGPQANSITDEMIEDCAKEAVNMMGGNLLHKFDAEKAFYLFIPFFEKKAGVFMKQEDASTEPAWKLFFESEKNLLGIKLNIITA